MRIERIVVLALLLACAFRSEAHEGPDDAIHALTHRIGSQGASARLLTARAYEYRQLGQWDRAVTDFRAALTHDGHYAPAYYGLAAALLHQGEHERAKTVARHGLREFNGAAQRAPYHALLAKNYAAQEDWTGALGAWRAALKSPQPKVDWFLGEAVALEHLGRTEARRAALKEATSRNPSAVLRRSWIAALIDAGAMNEAAVEIAHGLNQARFGSAWLLLRARLAWERGNRAEAREDAARTCTFRRRKPARFSIGPRRWQPTSKRRNTTARPKRGSARCNGWP